MTRERELSPWARDLRDAHHTSILSREPHSVDGDDRRLSRLDDFIARSHQLLRDDPLFEKVEIEVNVGCNRRCTYCFLHTERRERNIKSRSRLMRWDLFERLLEQLADLSFAGVLCYHFYAEPLLNKDLHVYVAEAKRRLPMTRSIVYTNGDFLDEARYNVLMGAGIDVIYVTRHDNAIPVQLQKLLDRPEIVVSLRADMALNNRAGYLGVHPDPRVRELPCIFFSESIVVTIDGNVLPCSCDFKEAMTMGNIERDHLRSIYYSERARVFRSNLLAGRRSEYGLCRDCDYYSDVLGLASAAEHHRDIEQEPFNAVVPRSRRPARPGLGDES